MSARGAATWARWADDVSLELEVREELATHIDEAYRALLAEGLAPEVAEARALARMGDLESHVAACVAARSRGTLTMKTAFSLLCAVLLAALAFSLIQAHQLRGEVAETRRLLVEMSGSRDLPRAPRVPEPVVFGIGDRLAIHDSLHAELNLGPVVAGDGMILLPELGWVEAYGKERSAFEVELNARYAPYYDETQIVVALQAAAD